MDDINMDLRGVGCDSMYWINLTQDRDKFLTLVIMVFSPYPANV